MLLRLPPLRTVFSTTCHHFGVRTRTNPSPDSWRGCNGCERLSLKDPPRMQPWGQGSLSHARDASNKLRLHPGSWPPIFSARGIANPRANCTRVCKTLVLSGGQFEKFLVASGRGEGEFILPRGLSDAVLDTFSYIHLPGPHVCCSARVLNLKEAGLSALHAVLSAGLASFEPGKHMSRRIGLGMPQGFALAKPVSTMRAHQPCPRLAPGAGLKSHWAFSRHCVGCTCGACDTISCSRTIHGGSITTAFGGLLPRPFTTTSHR